MPGLTTLTRNNRRVANGDIETSSQNSIHRRNGVRDMIPLALPMSARDLDKDAPVELPRRHTERRPRHLGGDLVDARHLEVALWTGGIVRGDRGMMGYLLGEEDDADAAGVSSRGIGVGDAEVGGTACEALVYGCWGGGGALALGESA